MEAFYAIRDFPPIKTLDEEAEFHAMLREQLARSMRLLKTLARAGKEIAPYMTPDSLRDFLNSFISRYAQAALVGPLVQSRPMCPSKAVLSGRRPSSPCC